MHATNMEYIHEVNDLLHQCSTFSWALHDWEQESLDKFFFWQTICGVSQLEGNE